MDEFIPENCHLLTKVNLVVPIINRDSQNGTRLNIPQVASVSLQHFHRNQFKYDATWFTKRFHNFGALWINQSSIVQDKISFIIKNAFTKELNSVDIDTWVSKKMLSLQKRIDSAKSKLKTMGSANDSKILIKNENIDEGLFT